jgi:virulence-associated protein VapD
MPNKRGLKIEPLIFLIAGKIQILSTQLNENRQIISNVRAFKLDQCQDQKIENFPAL